MTQGGSTPGRPSVFRFLESRAPRALPPPRGVRGRCAMARTLPTKVLRLYADVCQDRHDSVPVDVTIGSGGRRRLGGWFRDGELSRSRGRLQGWHLGLRPGGCLDRSHAGDAGGDVAPRGPCETGVLRTAAVLRPEARRVDRGRRAAGGVTPK
jgi:hypothetical protein